MILLVKGEACQYWGLIYLGTMKLEELKEWIKAHRHVTNSENDYDSSGNHEESRIYTDDKGKYFIIEFKNGSPYEKWDNTIGKHGGGFVRGEYGEPKEVFKKTRVVEYYDYKP